MSTATLRVIAIAVAVIAAALTGLATAMLSETEDGGLAVVPGGIAGGGALLTGLLLIVLSLGARRGEGGEHATAEQPAGDSETVTALNAHLDQLAAERLALVNTCVYVRDRATSRAIADRIGQALHDVGVVTIAPTGVPFDPSHHEAGGNTPAPDASSVGVIAAVEVPGYADKGTLLRAPVVTVYRQKNGA